MLRDPQQEVKTIHTCEQCDGEIYEGYYYFEYDNTVFCDDDCLQEFVMEWVKSEARECVA